MTERIHSSVGVLVGVAALAATVMTSCTGGGGDAKHVDSSSARATTSARALPVVKVPAKVPNDVASRKNVSLSSCGANKGTWSAVGTARNPGRQAATYKITVFFTTSGNTVVGVDQVTATVEPGKEVNWTAKATVRLDGTPRCILRGVSS